MTTDMSEVTGRLRAPWGPPNPPYFPSEDPPATQVAQVWPPRRQAEPNCDCCTPQMPSAHTPPTRYATEPAWGTQYRPEDVPGPAPDAELYDSDYGGEPEHPSYIRDPPSGGQEDEAEDPFATTYYQAMRRITHPHQDPGEITGCSPLPRGNDPTEERPYWEEDPAQEAWDDEEAQLYPTQLADRGAEPEPYTASSSWDHPAPVTPTEEGRREA